MRVSAKLGVERRIPQGNAAESRLSRWHLSQWRLSRSAIAQMLVSVLALAAIAMLHGTGDGLWFQGDAPRHAMNGLFWWDLLRAAPRDPVEFVVQYYARFPALSPVTYPPLFYLIEGMAFAIAGPSPYVARVLVLCFAATACAYTMLWARRWIDPMAGWAGTALALTPAMVVWSNSVMLNVPALAVALGMLYHARRWIESSARRQLVLTMLFTVATVATYFQAESVLAIGGAWVVWQRSDIRDRRQLRWMAAAGAVALLPVVVALALAPVQLARHLPPLSTLASARNWTYYWRALPELTGWGLLASAGLGLLVSFATPRWRREAVYLGLWIVMLLVAMSFLPARESRYVLLAAPALVMSAALGIVCITDRWTSGGAWMNTLVVVASLSAMGLLATHTRVPTVSGIRDVAAYLAVAAPNDAVLFDGDHSGVFVFYMRSLDPDFQRRTVLASKLLYAASNRRTFEVVEESYVASTDDVVTALRSRAGTRYVAFERGSIEHEVAGRRLLREALQRADFTLVRSFPVSAWDTRRIDLYRLEGTVTPILGVDLTFPSFSTRRFLQVRPITR